LDQAAQRGKMPDMKLMSMRKGFAPAALLLLPLALTGCKLKDQDAAQNASGTAPIANEPAPIPAPADVAAPPANALKTPSGLSSKVITVGLGSAHPSSNSMVTVHYTGWTTDGKMFETTVGREPVQFHVGEVIPGWTEGLKLMVAGEKRRFWIPGNLAYDDDPRPGAPKGMLVFDIELIAIR
jgi:FKBP-type peptidyl-prolyl cis-trans isomerase